MDACILKLYLALSCVQVNKKDKPEPKPLTITPSENTHFRVILSTEAMEEREGERATEPICSIVKPEPRTIRFDQCGCKPQPPEASSRNTNITEHTPHLLSSSFTSEPCPANSDLSPKPTRTTRWTSSPPNRRDSGSAASGVIHMAEDPAAVCPKTSESPAKRRGNTTSFIIIIIMFSLMRIKGL